MCGIIGYIGTKKAKPILINGLLRLEYRGYDSSGIATVEKDGIKVIKEKGRIANLDAMDGINDLEGTIGIGHTRWATHGKPSAVNSHPHYDKDKLFAVVHNGIIENYHELRKLLEDNGYTFLSDTDTEVIPNLINLYYKKENDFLKAVKLACDDLKGSFALEILCKYYPDNMIVVRQDSPLVIGRGLDENYISSDIPAILSFTKDFYFLNDREFAVLARDNIDFYDNDLNKIDKVVKSIEWNTASAEKDGYDDFMLKEIYEQPNAIRETIGSKLSESKISFNDFEISKEFLETINRIYVVACGTAMNAGLATKATFENFCKIPTEVDIASEFRYRDPLIDEHTLCIYISQSGETADTIAALKLAKSKGAKTIALANVIGSSITREADYCIYTHAGPEIAVASTKAYTSQVVLLNILALYFAEVLDRVPSSTIDSMKKNLLELPKKAEITLRNVAEVKNFANIVYKETDMFFLGRGVDYYVASEGSLKLKEISYIHSESYAAGELKHGPIALIENDVTVIGIITNPNLVEKTISNIQEVITRGAKTLVITNQKINESQFFKVINIPDTEPCLSPVLSIIPLQLLSYYISKEKGLDVDKPRNLAKSVTVE
ncbi:glucosamine--fructose-6-phosphate aminotransferase [isomerizing] [Clostridium sp. CAG:354]|nr:glutamine--fructose-6-phosphate transaminase (isomerizing) [Clostridium sp.]MEE0268404.1 glutamine--fructose-6-phosphate transaminase (isomerizing) [Clostridia bacterium]CDE11152.1 glucosamine--fructose-6-phosphate aminotransferase [isomerizing] [Clostridium sp. CAG:354]